MSNLQAEYNRMWQGFHESTQSSEFFVDLPPKFGDNRWGLSLIFMLKPAAQLTQNLQQVVAELNPLVGSTQLHYNSDTLHTTIRSLLPYQTDEIVRSQVKDYAEVIQSVARHFAPIIISYAGLTASKATIMAQGYPNNNDLVAFREQLATELTKNQLASTPELLSIRKTAHASLIVLTAAPNNPNALLKYLTAHRSTHFGEIEVVALELVSYLRQHSNVLIQSLGTVELT